MWTLGAAELLQVWERGQVASAPERALLLLDAASPGASPGDLPVGERDGHLLALRERLFGCALVAVAECPDCGEKLELPLDTRHLALPAPASRQGLLEKDGFTLQFRLPTGADLAALAPCGDVVAVERQLLESCVLDARRGGAPVAARDLPESVLEGLSQAMEEADPCADIRVEATCPQCGLRFETSFDIVPFLWTELQDWAIRILGEVHALAATYGWSERDILALTPWRRRLYLQWATP